MKFTYEAEQLHVLSQAQGNTFLLSNGLGGYSSVSSVYSVPRSDQGILVAGVKAPNVRLTLVHRMRECLRLGKESYCLSTQQFADDTAQECGNQYLTAFSFQHVPVWEYQIGQIQVRRQLCMAQEKNTAALLYTVSNPTQQEGVLELTPFMKFAPKELALEEPQEISLMGNAICCQATKMYIHTEGKVEERKPLWQKLSYPEDAKDGRPAWGMAGACCSITAPVPAGQTVKLQLVFSLEDTPVCGWQLLQEHLARMETLLNNCHFRDPIARQLVVAADAYIARRESTNGKTILAGYPLFSDWGRDTMIALPGCTLATGRYEDAKSILRTFLAYERDGLVPNLFPEGDQAPMYNTVDAALLLIDAVWQYYQHTKDLEFVREAWPVMKRIVAAYQTGTHHGIGMDTDGLIFAGEGLDQVTWMDVRINDILPTPRHGKPVEINAYWYNALMILQTLAPQMGVDGTCWAALAEKVKASFLEKFYLEEGYLKDVISGTQADTQIRCNQIWALSMPFTMLSAHQERKVLDTVGRHLLTECGLRTLSPADPQYHGFYGGEQLQRDMAYHQGTSWVFPMGAYYRAYLRLHGNDAAAAAEVRQRLKKLQPMLEQGCAGQLPEIYDGDAPYEGKGCFGQAWSVGEMLRVYEDIYRIENKEG